MGRGVRSEAARKRRLHERLRVSTVILLRKALGINVKAEVPVKPFTRKQTFNYLIKILNKQQLDGECDNNDTSCSDSA